MTPEVSVIIPMYNAMEFIRSTVNSLLNQTLKEIEIILVDDCSSDGSVEYCEALFGGEARVRILRQSRNMGPGEARNTGIRHARGRYVAFVDSDDQMKRDGLSAMFTAARQTGADVLHVAGILIPTADELPEDLSQVPPEGITPISFDQTGRRDERFRSWKQHAYHWSVWNKLFRREFLIENEILFSSLKLAEDMHFCFQCLFLAKTYTIIPGAWYYWRVVAGSASRPKKIAPLIVKSLKAELEAGEAVRAVTGRIPFFAGNEQRIREAVFCVINSLERAFIRPGFQSLGRENVEQDEEIASFFRDAYQDKADAAFYYFLEMQSHMSVGVDYGKVFSGKDAWQQFAYELGNE